MRQRCQLLAARACRGAWYVDLVRLGMSEGKFIATAGDPASECSQLQTMPHWPELICSPYNGIEGAARAWDRAGN